MNRAMAGRLAARSELVYEPPEEIAKHVHRILWLDHDGTQAMLIPPGPGQDWTEVIFRGTQIVSAWYEKNPLEAWKDIRSNLHAWQRRWPEGGWVHEGYAEAIDDVSGEIGFLLSQYAGSTPIIYAGHSLGGVLATLMASRRPPTETYTFGAPSPGDAEFWKTIETPLHRIVLEGDIAPKYPRPWWGYAQSERYWLLDRQGGLRRKRWRSWRDTLIVPLTGEGLLAGIRRHKVGGYRRLLEMAAV